MVNQTNRNNKRRTSIKHTREEKCIQNFGRKSVKRRLSPIFPAPVQARKEMTHTPTFTTVPLPNKTAPKVLSSLAGCIQTNRHWRQKNPLFWLARCISFSRWTDPAGTYKTSATRLRCWQAITAACHPFSTVREPRFWRTEQRRRSQAPAPMPIDRAREAKYRNIVPGQEKAPTLKCRAFFSTQRSILG